MRRVNTTRQESLKVKGHAGLHINDTESLLFGFSGKTIHLKFDTKNYGCCVLYVTVCCEVKAVFNMMCVKTAYVQKQQQNVAFNTRVRLASRYYGDGVRKRTR